MPSVMRMPVAPILERHGIAFTTKNGKDGIWYQLKECPVCNKGGYQCAVAESINSDGKLVHSMKCWHTSAKYEDFLRALNIDPTAMIAELPRLKLVPPQPLRTQKDPGGPGLMNEEANAVLRKRLRENEEAMRWLMGRGLTQETANRFKLGLSKPYTNKKGLVIDLALAYPLFYKNGQPVKRYGYYNIPELTQNPIDDNGWMAGEVATYYSDSQVGKTAIFVCEGVKDLWRLWQEVHQEPWARHILFVSSTHGKGIPVEWKDPEFWATWDKVYFGQDNDTTGMVLAALLMECVGRDAFRVKVPTHIGKDWTDFFKAGGTADEFKSFLEHSPLAAHTINDKPEDNHLPGLYEYAPIDINGSFHKGHLYYTVTALTKEFIQVKADDGTDKEVMAESQKSMVVRSDGRLLSAYMSPAVKGTQLQDRVWRLEDGTLIDKMPQPSKYSSWSWPSVRRFCDTWASGKTINTRPVAAMIWEIEGYLRSRVWLPEQDQYMLLALAAVVSYIQPVFDALPLFLVNGPKASGKTELGRAMCDVCANAPHPIGQGSAATIARLIDQTRGFVVLDDLEAIGNKDAMFSELIQGLKLSYKKDSAFKIWTDVKTMQVQKLNFYGIKMINNTLGVDSILGSRMFFIQTRKMTPKEIQVWHSTRGPVKERPRWIRDELHVWAFQNVKKVDALYRDKYPQGLERGEEIAAPLRVIADLSGDPSIKGRLEAALARQSVTPVEVDDPQEILEEALINLIAEGYREITVEHISLEMRRLVPDNYGKERTNDIPELFQTKKITRWLNSNGWIERDRQIRAKILGKSLRAYVITKDFIDEVMLRLEQAGRIAAEPSRSKESFCMGCDGCPYRNAGCDLMALRQADEKRSIGKLRQVK